MPLPRLVPALRAGRVTAGIAARRLVHPARKDGLAARGETVSVPCKRPSHVLHGGQWRALKIKGGQGNLCRGLRRVTSSCREGLPLGARPGTVLISADATCPRRVSTGHPGTHLVEPPPSWLCCWGGWDRTSGVFCSSSPPGSTSTQMSLVGTSPVPRPIMREPGGAIPHVPEGRTTPNAW